MALGDLFYEAKGKIMGQRVLDTEGPKIETTVSYDGIMKSGGNHVDVAHVATFWSSQRSSNDGAFFVEGKGVITPTTGKICFLNNLVGGLEYEADETGNSTLKVWEWK